MLQHPRIIRPALALALFLATAASVQAQVPVNRNVINRVPVTNRDTIKPRVVVNPRDTAKPRVVVNPRDTVKPIRNIDVIAVNPALLRYPDTIVIGAYTLVVEAYDKGGEWNANAKQYQHLNGTGRIKFTCPGFFLPRPDIYRGAIMKPTTFRVVENNAANENEISLAQANELGLNTKSGAEVELMMPVVNGRRVELSRFITDMKVPVKASGIKVRFTDCTVSVEKAGVTSGILTAGAARYPTEPAEPALPMTLSPYPGFQLQVSAIQFGPGGDPKVTAKLLLPSSLIQYSECGRGTLDLGEFTLRPNCEFYKEFPAADFGVFGVGATGLAIGGKGFVVDFSASQSYPASGKPANWKGVVLLQGGSEGQPSGTVISNTGYLQARYTFSNGLVESGGLTANFSLAGPYSYGTTQPYGYTIDFNTASLTVEASKITGGNLRDGNITLPSTSVQLANGDPVVIPQLSLTVQPSLNLEGHALIKPDMTVFWGDLVGAGGGNRKSFGAYGFTRDVRVYFSSTPRAAFLPVASDGKTFTNLPWSTTPDLLDSLGIQGATLGRFSHFIVNTQDIPNGYGSDPNKPKPTPADNKVWYRFSGKDQIWINVVTGGVHCHIDGELMESPDVQLGDSTRPLYAGGPSFTVTAYYNKQRGHILLQCVESAVLNCDYRSFIKQPAPVDAVLAFKEMVFTSTANNAGGDLAIGSNDSLAYWGLKLVPKPGFSSAGLVSVKTGQIVMTAAGLAEYKHFSQPFWVTWGEMLANGSMGRLFFDFHVAGQQFDKFNFVHDAVSLSPVDADVTKKGYLRVGGTAFFPFFAADYLHIRDHYVPDKPGYPFDKREIKLSSETLKGFDPSDKEIDGNWSDGLGIFHFAIQYNDGTQDGFLGEGNSAVRYISGGAMKSTLDMNSRGTCIRIGTDLLDMRSVSLGPVANISKITRIWGCVCIKGDNIENLVVGGEVSDAANVSIAARTGSYLSAILQVTPSLARFTLDGEAYMSIMASVDALINGHLQLTLNHAEGFVEGEVAGKIRVAEGAVLVGSSLEAEGQLNWHLGIDFSELQGMVALKVMGFSGGSSVGAGFYAGVNAPKSRAWVLLGKDPRYGLNMTPMPDRLTGVYGFVSIHEGLNLYIISGGIDLYVGLGAFVNPAPLAVGNLGGRIYGDILGGLVSAAASFNLQLLLGYPFGFQGTVGLEACVLWVICGSVDITVGLNTAEGFYVR